MKRKVKIAVAFLLILLISVIVFSVIYFFGSPPLNLSVKVEKDIFEKGEPVEIDVILKNVGLWPVTIEDVGFGGVRVEDERGFFVSRVFPVGSYPQISHITLDRGDKIRRVYEWPQIGEEFAGPQYEVSTGTYQFEAWVFFKCMGRLYDWETSPTRIVIV